jgi:hypothetical protein
VLPVEWYREIMLKRLFRPSEAPAPRTAWLDLAAVTAEMTSESPSHPIENALLLKGGWQASEPGPQTIRLVFDQPQRIKRINLVFSEFSTPRTQEFVLRWSGKDSRFREIVRQQWNFSPPDTTREIEIYDVDLPDVAALELRIVPDISGGTKYASLEVMRLA